METVYPASKTVILILRSRYTFSKSEFYWFIKNNYFLGPILIESKGVKAKRSDFELINQRNLILKCSIYEPEIDASEPRSCIIYLHCFNGSRIESVRYAEQIISERISFVCFDFSASGLSAGEYVSLGWYESQDV